MLSLSLPALLLGLSCGVLYSAADTFRKAVPTACPSETILFYYIGGQLPVLAAWVLWTGETTFAPGYFLPGMIDVVFGLGANLFFIVAIRRSPLSLMVPLLALVPVVTLLLGGVALGEWPTIAQDIGVLLIAAGLFTLFQPPAAKPGIGAAWRLLRAEKGTAPMLVVVFLWSGTPALDKICLGYTSAGMHSLIQVAAIWILLMIWALWRRPASLRPPPGAMAPIGCSAIAGAVGYIVQLIAYAAAMVALIEVLKRTVGLLGSLVLGRAQFREPLTGAKIAGIGIIAVGLPLVMIG